MKNYLFFICLLIFNISFAQNKKKATDEEKLAKSILENTNYFTFNDDKPIGKGWEILANLFAENQFVAWGEYHNSPSLSQLTHYALEEASQRGCKIWCIETSPFAASELSNMPKTADPLQTLAKINQKRAMLMKANFYRYYDPLKNKNEKIFFKMGSNHLAKGMNLDTNLYDIGNVVYELSQRNQTGFANIYFMVRFTEEDGKLADDLQAEIPQNPKVFSRLYNKEKWVLLDLKSLRLKMRYDNSLTADTYKLIEKYDYVVISPEILK